MGTAFGASAVERGSKSPWLKLHSTSCQNGGINETLNQRPTLVTSPFASTPRFSRSTQLPLPGSAPCIPDAAPSVNRSRRSLSQNLLTILVLTSSWLFSIRKRWFPCGPLPGSHLTRSDRAFSFSAHYHGLCPQQRKWLGASSCKTAPKGLPSSTTQLRKLATCRRLVYSWRTQNTSLSAN